MSDRDRWDLRGSVRTADIQRTWRFWKRGSGESGACELTEGGDHSIVEFRPDGSLARRHHWNPDGSEWTTILAYDDAGRLVSTRSESSHGAVGLGLCEYDRAGRLARQLSRDADGKEGTIESYSYDGEGRKTKTPFVDLAAQHANTNHSWAIEGSQALYSAPNAAKLTTRHDQAGRPTELLFHDAAGALVSQDEFLYDASGNLTEEPNARASRSARIVITPSEIESKLSPPCSVP